MPHMENKECMDACQTCAVECEHCATACLQEPDAQARTRCIQLLRDCADICFMSAAYMGRGSQYARDLCRLCAEICEACGTECARFKDEHCQRCAAECRRCADECRKMAGKVAATV